MVTVSRDVTERVERARFRELVQSVTTVANAAGSADDALEGALAVICRLKGWPLGHVYMITDEGADELVPTTIWYSEESTGHAEFRRVTEATRFRRGIGLPGRVLASGQPAWIPNVLEDPNFPRARLVKNLGLAAAFGFPVRAGERILAVLEFFTTEVLAPEERFLEVLDEIGDMLGQALQRLQVEETLRGSEALLEQAQAIAGPTSCSGSMGASRGRSRCTTRSSWPTSIPTTGCGSTGR
jgi:GAF domain-containing protein